MLAGEVGVAEKAVDSFLAKGLEDGVLLEVKSKPWALKRSARGP
jgi:hypothetical protein